MTLKRKSRGPAPKRRPPTPSPKDGRHARPPASTARRPSKRASGKTRAAKTRPGRQARPRKAPAPGASGLPERPAAPGERRTPAPGVSPVSRITPEQQIVGAVFLGKVMNYYSHLGVATVVLEAPAAVGDMIRIKGHTTDLTQRIDSLQVKHESVQTASAGEGVGIRVADKVRAGDAVFKV